MCTNHPSSSPTGNPGNSGYVCRRWQAWLLPAACARACTVRVLCVVCCVLCVGLAHCNTALLALALAPMPMLHRCRCPRRWRSGATPPACTAPATTAACDDNFVVRNGRLLSCPSLRGWALLQILKCGLHRQMGLLCVYRAAIDQTTHRISAWVHGDHRSPK